MFVLIVTQAWLCFGCVLLNDQEEPSMSIIHSEVKEPGRKFKIRGPYGLDQFKPLPIQIEVNSGKMEHLPPFAVQLELRSKRTGKVIRKTTKQVKLEKKSNSWTVSFPDPFGTEKNILDAGTYDVRICVKGLNNKTKTVILPKFFVLRPYNKQNYQVCKIGKGSLAVWTDGKGGRDSEIGLYLQYCSAQQRRAVAPNLTVGVEVQDTRRQVIFQRANLKPAFVRHNETWIARMPDVLRTKSVRKILPPGGYRLRVKIYRKKKRVGDFQNLVWFVFPVPN